jgi:hypothetical protein
MRQGISQDGPKLWPDGKLWEPKDKAKSATIGIAQQLEEHPAEPEVKKLRVHSSDQDKHTGEEEKTSAT